MIRVFVHRTESYQVGFFHWQWLGSFADSGACRSERPDEIPHPCSIKSKLWIPLPPQALRPLSWERKPLTLNLSDCISLCARNFLHQSNTNSAFLWSMCIKVTRIYSIFFLQDIARNYAGHWSHTPWFLDILLGCVDFNSRHSAHIASLPWQPEGLQMHFLGK